MNIKVAIAEDIEDIRNGLFQIISNTEGFECGCTCKDGNEALEKLPAYQADVVLMDINMPGVIGVEVVRLLKPKMPDTQFMMCTIYEEDEHIFESLKAGATGYILKKTQPAELLQAITEIYQGGSPMSSTIARKVMTSFSNKDIRQPVDKLSIREREILQLLGRGTPYKIIAANLFISIETVRTHIRNIYDKLQVHSREEAVRKAFKR